MPKPFRSVQDPLGGATVVVVVALVMVVVLLELVEVLELVDVEVDVLLDVLVVGMGVGETPFEQPLASSKPQIMSDKTASTR